MRSRTGAEAQTTPLFDPVLAPTMAEQVADSIVESIASGRVQPGQRLVETELAEALHVSRVPVREAIRILHSQGIVLHTPRRGMRVTDFDAAWAKELHDVRTALEKLCAHQCAEILREDADARAALDESLRAITEACTSRDWLRINRQDLAFHSSLFALTGSPLLWTLWSAIARHVLVMFSIETDRGADFDRVVEEHERFVHVLLHGSPTELDTEVEDHVAGKIALGRRAAERGRRKDAPRRRTA